MFPDSSDCIMRKNNRNFSNFDSNESCQSCQRQLFCLLQFECFSYLISGVSLIVSFSQPTVVASVEVSGSICQEMIFSNYKGKRRRVVRDHHSSCNRSYQAKWKADYLESGYFDRVYVSFPPLPV